MPRRARTVAELEALLAERDAALAEWGRELAGAPEMLGAAQRVLSSISRAGGDLQAVLDTIAESAMRLCGTDRSRGSCARRPSAPGSKRK